MIILLKFTTLRRVFRFELHRVAMYRQITFEYSTTTK